jgi:hypothetical protein
VRKIIAVLLIFGLTPLVLAQTQTQKPTKSPEEILKEIRAETQGAKSDILAKNLTLTSEQAAKFWPMYAAYQKEQDVIIDQQVDGIREYVEKYESLDDATALRLLNAHFDRDTKMVALRKKWLAEFQKVLGAKLAVRAMQIDRRLSLAAQFEISRLIPLAH